ncbi:MAG: DUF952 domain-containing protein [Acidimicrobiales bacterium]|nr:DUF952 domain-containing protein [Acidimicrobiales bacterium]
MTAERLLHIVAAADWATAQRIGELRPGSLTIEGFVHLSWPRQLAGTAARFYAGASDHRVLVVDPARLTDPVVEEQAADVDDRFPHLYGPLPVDAVVAVHRLEEALDGLIL